MSNNFTTTTRGELMAEGIRCLRDAEVEAPRRSVLWMMEDVLACSRGHLLAHPALPVPPEQVRRMKALLKRRCRGEPLQYVLGHTDFYGLRLQVGPAVLIPRPETEEVVAYALHLLDGCDEPRFLDVGTGSGCIALALKDQRPAARAHACDVSEEALQTAAANAERHALDVRFFQADMLGEEFGARAPGSLDLLISNPPYIAQHEKDTLPSEVIDHEPPHALFAGEDPLSFYRVLTQKARPLLDESSWLVFEVHAHHGEAVKQLLLQNDFAEVHLKEDLAGRPRIAAGRKL